MPCVFFLNNSSPGHHLMVLIAATIFDEKDYYASYATVSLQHLPSASDVADTLIRKAQRIGWKIGQEVTPLKLSPDDMSRLVDEVTEFMKELKTLPQWYVDQALERKTDEWHRSEKPGELHDFLGMTETEYAAWIKDPNQVPARIVNALA